MSGSTSLISPTFYNAPFVLVAFDEEERNKKGRGKKKTRKLGYKAVWSASSRSTTSLFVPCRAYRERKKKGEGRASGKEHYMIFLSIASSERGGEKRGRRRSLGWARIAVILLFPPILLLLSSAGYPRSIMMETKGKEGEKKKPINGPPFHCTAYSSITILCRPAERRFC